MGITETETAGRPGRPSESASENTPELNTPQDGEFDASVQEYLVQFGGMAAMELSLAATEDNDKGPPLRSLIPKPSRTFTNVSAADTEPWITVDASGIVPKTSGEEDEETAVYDFFIQDDGQSLLADLDGEKFPRPLTIASHHRPPTAASTRTRRSRLSRLRVFSAASENSVDQYGAVVLTLSQLCDAIDQHQSLQRAEIISTEGYVERLGAITHRFLVLLLRRQGRKPVYIRLDRRLGKNTSTFHLLRSNGSTPANDVAQFASDKVDLLGDARLENKQIFDTIPSLGELRHFLGVICEEIQTYQVWPANCWFFCSLLQQHLGGANEGRFIDGSLQFSNLARDIRHRVKARLGLFYHMPSLPSITALLMSFQTNDHETIQSAITAALNLSTKWDSVCDLHSTRQRRLGSALGQSLMPILAYLHTDQYYLEERILWEHRIALFRQLFDRDPYSHRHAADLAESLFNYGVCLYDCKAAGGAHYGGGGGGDGGQVVADASVPLAESVGIRRLLYTRDERYRGDLANALHNYGIALSESGRVLDACKAEEETVALRRQMYMREPLSRRYRGALAHSLYNYGLSLADADSEGSLDCIEDACSVFKECVWLRREQLIDRTSGGTGTSPSSSTAVGSSMTMNGQNRHIWGLELAMALHAYGWALHSAQRYDEARSVKEEAVAVLRTSPAHRRADLAAALHNLGSTLHCLGKIDEACNAYREAAVIRRRDVEVDSKRYLADYEHSLHDFNICTDLLRPKLLI